jgi:DNA polymerase III epsilon subunit-like protein
VSVADEVQPEATETMFDAEQTKPVPWWRRRMCGLDTETTRPEWDAEDSGPDVQQERIVSVGIALVGGGGATWSHTWLVNPGFPMPPESTAIHGIHDEDVADAPSWDETAEDVLDVLWTAANDRMALVAYNAAYDCTVLDRNLRRAGVGPDVLQALWFELRVVDPLLIDRMLDTYRRGSRKLPSVTAIWEARAKRRVEEAGREWKGSGKPLDRGRDGRHDAAEDAIAVCRLAWLQAAFGEVYSYDRPLRTHDRPPGDMVARQRHWEATVDDLDALFTWQREYRREDQQQLADKWRAEGNPRWETVRPEWPVYPEGVKVG